MKDETTKFKMEQLKSKINYFMNQEGKPICECGQLAMIGSKYCNDCLVPYVIQNGIKTYKSERDLILSIIQDKKAVK